MAMVKKEIPSDKNWKENFCETLCDRYVYSSHIDKTFLILCSLQTPSSTDLQRDIREHIQAYGEKGDIFR